MKKKFFTLIGSYVSYKRYFGKNFIRNDGNIMKVNEVNCLSYRSWPGFYGVTLKISVVGKYPGSDWTKPVIIGGTQRKRQDCLWMSSSGKTLKRGGGVLGSGQPHEASVYRDREKQGLEVGRTEWYWETKGKEAKGRSVVASVVTVLLCPGLSSVVLVSLPNKESGHSSE